MARNIEMRYYELPADLPVIALLGKEWEVVYGTDRLHFHNCLEIGYCYRGEGRMVFEDHEAEYESGTVTFIPKNVPHHTIGDEKVQKWEYLFFEPATLLNQIFAEQPFQAKAFAKALEAKPIILSGETADRMKELLCMIFEEMREKKKYQQLAVKGLLTKLMLEYVRMLESESAIPVSDVKDNGYIREVLDYIEQHYSENIKIKDLAQAVHLSETHFRRIFQDALHEEPLDYLNLVRIDKSCELLIKTGDSVQIIAEKVGFPIVSTYNRNFKKITGMTPYQWRIKAKKDPENAILNYNVTMLKGY